MLLEASPPEAFNSCVCCWSWILAEFNTKLKLNNLGRKQGQSLASVALIHRWCILAVALCAGVLVCSFQYFIVCVVPEFCAHLAEAPTSHLVLMRRSLLSGKTRWPPASLLSRKTLMPIVEIILQVQFNPSPNLHFYKSEEQLGPVFSRTGGGAVWHNLTPSINPESWDVV